LPLLHPILDIHKGETNSSEVAAYGTKVPYAAKYCGLWHLLLVSLIVRGTAGDKPELISDVCSFPRTKKSPAFASGADSS